MSETLMPRRIKSLERTSTWVRFARDAIHLASWSNRLEPAHGRPDNEQHADTAADGGEVQPAMASGREMGWAPMTACPGQGERGAPGQTAYPKPLITLAAASMSTTVI